MFSSTITGPTWHVLLEKDEDLDEDNSFTAQWINEDGLPDIPDEVIEAIYDNSDGWEWMAKSGWTLWLSNADKTIVREVEGYTDYSPQFSYFIKSESPSLQE